MRSSRSSDSRMPRCTGSAPPERPVPPPRGVTATRSAVAKREHRRDLLGGGRERHRLGQELQRLGLVAAVGGDRVRFGEQAVCAEQLAQPVQARRVEGLEGSGHRWRSYRADGARPRPPPARRFRPRRVPRCAGGFAAVLLACLPPSADRRIHAMIQELFHIGPVSISPFGVMLMLAFLASYAQLAWGFKKSGAGDAEDASALVFWGGLAGVAGGEGLLRDPLPRLAPAVRSLGAGLVRRLSRRRPAVIWTMRRRGLRFWPTADALTPALALGYGIGRIGCFLVGDDYGVPTHLPWGVAFPVGLPPTRAGWLRSEFHLAIPSSIPDDTLLRVHPTQIYEFLLAAGDLGGGPLPVAARAARGDDGARGAGAARLRATSGSSSCAPRTTASSAR